MTAVGLGPFPGALALSVHSIGMLGQLFAETIEQMDMAPIHALELTGARRIQVFSHGIIPSILPSLLGICLYRLDENIRSSLVLGFVGAGGIGFQILTAMNLFQYQDVSLLLIIISSSFSPRSAYRLLCVRAWPEAEFLKRGPGQFVQGSSPNRPAHQTGQSIAGGASPLNRRRHHSISKSTDPPGERPWPLRN